MTPTLAGTTAQRSRKRTAGSTRAMLPVAIAACAIVAAVVLWHYNTPAPAVGPVSTNSAATLSDSTRSILKTLEPPVEIRFYALLDPAAPQDSWHEFAGRVSRLLDEYEREADGKITVTRFGASQNFNQEAAAAAADGIQSFNAEKGQACYLGIAVAHKQQKETLAHIAPEWEAAVEADLSRALQRVAGLGSPAVATPPPVNATAIDEVKRAIPNLDSISVDEGTRILRESALKDFKAAAGEMESQIQQAQQRLTDAQNSGSAADQQAAMKRLQELQAAQAERLKQIAAKSDAEIQALQQIKSGNH